MCDIFQAHADPAIHLACAKLLALAFDHPPLHAALLDSVAPSLLCKLLARYATAQHPVDVATVTTPQTMDGAQQPVCTHQDGMHDGMHDGIPVQRAIDNLSAAFSTEHSLRASTWLDAFLLQPLVPGDSHRSACSEQGATAPRTPAAAAAARARSIARDGALTACVALMVALRDTDTAVDTLCALGYAKHLHAVLRGTKDLPLHVAALQSLAWMTAAAPPEAAQQLLANGGLPTLVQLAHHGSGRCLGLELRGGAVECLALLTGHHDHAVRECLDRSLVQVVQAVGGGAAATGCGGSTGGAGSICSQAVECCDPVQGSKIDVGDSV